jgi:hypothetical protein
MVDKQTIMPTYDHYRGEQRGKLKKGQHAEDAIIMAYFYRTVESKYDFSQPMQFENDTYNAEMTLPLKGRWDVVIEVIKGDFLQRTSAKLFSDYFSWQ